MIDTWVPPVFIYVLGALALPFLRGSARRAWVLLVPLIALADMLVIYYGGYSGRFWSFDLAGFTLTFARIDALSMIFGFVFVIMSFIGNLYALHVKEWGQHTAAFLYAGSAIGTVFCGDLITLFIFWEVMAWSSVFLIWAGRRRESTHAGLRYLLVHNLGGAILLMGIVMHVGGGNPTDFGYLVAGGLTPATTLILIGFIINAAVPPLHAWLTDAYPDASITGAVFLSAFTTKTAVYVLLRGFPGTEILIYLGATMAVYGVIFAVLENDIRRLLSYHIVSQVGYMVCGVGMATVIGFESGVIELTEAGTMTFNGSAAHAFAHILYKGLLFMGAGAVIYMTGKSKLTELGGLYKTMPKTLTLYMIGGFAISSVPLFSGFVSKSMIIDGAGIGSMTLIWVMLVLASSGTFLHTGLKLPYFTFFGKDSGIRVDENKLPKNMIYAMAIAAFLCIGIGVYPYALYDLLPKAVDFVPYMANHVITEIQFLLFTALAFFMLLKLGAGTPTITLDTDWFYRKAGNRFLYFFNNQFSRFNKMLENVSMLSMMKLLRISWNPAVWLTTLFDRQMAGKYPDTPLRLSVINSSVVMSLIFIVLGILLAGGLI